MPNCFPKWLFNFTFLPGKWGLQFVYIFAMNYYCLFFIITVLVHILETEMATHSSVLALRISGMGEPGGLPSMGSHSRTRLKGLSSSSSSAYIVVSYCGLIFISIITNNVEHFFKCLLATVPKYLFRFFIHV